MTRFNRNGLSLGEVLVAIAIVGILLGLMLPAVRRVREPAARSVCQNNMKMVMVGMHNHASAAHRIPYEADIFPTGCIGPGGVPEERLSWMVDLLPYVEQDAVSRQFNVEKGFAGNSTGANTVIRTFLCPTTNGHSNNWNTSYIAMAGLGSDAPGRPAGAAGNGFMGYDRVTGFGMIKDGTANTIAVIECHANPGPWACGGPSTLRAFDPAEALEQQFGGGHEKILHVAMADGSVRTIRKNLPPGRLAAAITIAGNDPLNTTEWD